MVPPRTAPPGPRSWSPVVTKRVSLERLPVKWLLPRATAREGYRMNLPAEFTAAIINAFEANKRLADRAVEQVPDDTLRTALDPNTNSIAVIMKHVAGNLSSRWTDF